MLQLYSKLNITAIFFIGLSHFKSTIFRNSRTIDLVKICYFLYFFLADALRRIKLLKTISRTLYFILFESSVHHFCNSSILSRHSTRCWSGVYDQRLPTSHDVGQYARAAVDAYTRCWAGVIEQRQPASHDVCPGTLFSFPGFTFTRFFLEILNISTAGVQKSL